MPALAEALPPFRWPPHRRSEASADVSFLVAGLLAAVHGDAARGVERVLLEGSAPIRVRVRAAPREAEAPRADAGSSDWRAPAALEMRESAVGVERRLSLGSSELEERIFVPRELPAALMEWRGAGGPALSVEITITMAVARGAGVDRVERGLLIGGGAGEVAALLVVGSQPEVEWAAREIEPGRIEARAPLYAGGAGGARILLARVSDAHPLERIVRALRDAPSQVMALGASRTKRALEGLELAVAGTDLGSDLEWARVRLDAAPPAGDFRRVAARALAALALGDAEPARRALGLAGLPGELVVRLGVRTLGWTGNVALMHDVWPALLAAWERVRAGEEPGERSLLGAALARAALDLGVAAPPGTSDDAPMTADGPALPGFARPAEVEPFPGSLEGPEGLVLGLVEGVLGARPDAPRERLELAPRIPREWSEARMSRLAVGPARVSMRYAREGGHHRFVLDQEDGAASVRVAFAPSVAGDVARASVDGVPASLSIEREGGRSAIIVQLVLDHPRELVLEPGI